MDIFHFDTVKSEKPTAMLLYNRFRTVAKLFRFAEIFLGFVFFSWISSRLPFAVKISGEYFRLLSGIIGSNLFIFLLCNIIIVILYVNSGRFTAKTLAINAAETEIYEEFLKNSTGDRISSETEDNPVSHETEEIVYQDKQIISEVNAIPVEKEEKEYRRSLSENMKREIDCPKKLWRSETEICRKVVRSCENLLENPFPEDELSNEEFQRTIEEFIAKQLRFRREESSAIVVQKQS